MEKKNRAAPGIPASRPSRGYESRTAGDATQDQPAPGSRMQNAGCCPLPAGPGEPDGGAATAGQAARDTADITDGIQVVRSILSPRSYPDLTVRAGVPVRWVITAEEASLKSCNNAVSIPALGIYHLLSPGENIIEFLPEKPGVIPYSCWMGMIRAAITVTGPAP